MKQRNTTYLTVISVLTLIAIFNLPLVTSYWSGDDWPNSQTPYWIFWRYGEVNFHEILRESNFWIEQWIKGVGRFYPLAFYESRFVFSLFQSVFEYKLFQFFVTLTMNILLSLFVWRLTKLKSISVLSFLIFNFVAQYRVDFDPHLGFSLLMQSIIIKILLSEICFHYSLQLKKKTIKLTLAILGSIMLFLAFCTYEYAFSIALFPLLPVIWSLRKTKVNLKNFISSFRIVALSFWCFAVVSYFYIVFFFLRPKAQDISGAYVLGLSWQSLKVFFINLTAGLPFVGSTNIGWSNLNLNFLLIIFLIFTFGFVLNNIYRLDATSKILKRAKDKSFNEVQLDMKENTWLFFLIFVIFTIGPSFILALQEVWWNRIGFGKSYLGVLIQEIGFGFAIISFLNHNLARFIKQL